MDDDGGMQWWAEVGQRQEYEEWLADPVAQAEYQTYLNSLEEQKHEMD